MLNSPEAVQKQLSDAISLIGKHDFPDNWPNLLQTIIENFVSFAGVYLYKSLFKYYCIFVTFSLCFSFPKR